MTDHVSQKGRSRIMRSIRSKDTKPELFVRRLLHREGYRYRLHEKGLPGKPDIVFRSRKLAIFIHGCFWHQHDDPSCPIAQKPTSNKSYWIPKLVRNKERDAGALEKLQSMGWKVLVLWECQVNDESKLLAMLKKHIGATKHNS